MESQGFFFLLPWNYEPANGEKCLAPQTWNIHSQLRKKTLAQIQHTQSMYAKAFSVTHVCFNSNLAMKAIAWNEKHRKVPPAAGRQLTYLTVDGSIDRKHKQAGVNNFMLTLLFPPKNIDLEK